MSKSGYMEALMRAHKSGLDDGECIGNQYMLDIVVMVLHHDYGFGPKRVCDFVTRLHAVFDEYYPALVATKKNQECDVLRSHMDAVLAEALAGATELLEEKTLNGVRYNFVPFEKRYPKLRAVTYEK